jgi:hypothetical protein
LAGIPNADSIAFAGWSKRLKDLSQFGIQETAIQINADEANTPTVIEASMALLRVICLFSD